MTNKKKVSFLDFLREYAPRIAENLDGSFCMHRLGQIDLNGKWRGGYLPTDLFVAWFLGSSTDQKIMILGMSSKEVECMRNLALAITESESFMEIFPDYQHAPERVYAKSISSALTGIGFDVILLHNLNENAHRMGELKTHASRRLMGDKVVAYGKSWHDITSQIASEGRQTQGYTQDHNVVTVPSTSDARTQNNSTRSTYRVLTDEEKVLMDRLKTAGSDFIAMCHDIGGTDSSGDRLASRDLSLAVTHMEDAVMRAVRHLTK